MGLFGKIKNIFYDIEEVEVEKDEVKKETEISRPKLEKTEEVKIDPIVDSAPSERELFKTKNTFNFPIFDSDDEEEEKEVKTRVREEEVKDFELPKREKRRESFNLDSLRSSNETRNEPKDTSRKVFVPTPVISPVYGILDKNYKRDEVIPRKEVVEVRKSQTDYDYVRKKAYGTLEDELENTLTSIHPKEETIENLTEDLTQTIEKIDESSKNIEELLNEIETSKVSIGELEEKIQEKAEEEEKEKRIDNTLEHDLFNLIDSMYEDKEE